MDPQIHKPSIFKVEFTALGVFPVGYTHNIFSILEKVRIPRSVVKVGDRGWCQFHFTVTPMRAGNRQWKSLANIENHRKIQVSEKIR